MKDFVTIVTGYPRTGTSLMMRLLQAGGVEAIKDDVLHPPDELNPEGYFQCEVGDELAEGGGDPEWLLGQLGRAVKILNYRVDEIPPGLSCRVILMERQLDALAPSVAKLLAAHGHPIPDRGIGFLADAIADEITKGVRRLKDCESPLLVVKLEDLVADPPREIARVSNFLGGLDVGAMGEILRPTVAA